MIQKKGKYKEREKRERNRVKQRTTTKNYPYAKPFLTSAMTTNGGET
jgi:hypothetical protein